MRKRGAWAHLAASKKKRKRLREAPIGEQSVRVMLASNGEVVAVVAARRFRRRVVLEAVWTRRSFRGRRISRVLLDDLLRELDGDVDDRSSALHFTSTTGSVPFYRHIFGHGPAVGNDWCVNKRHS